MRITCFFRGKEEIKTFDRPEILIGRLSPLSAPDLDLGIDSTISRKHTRIRLENGQFWVEDLKSTNGTLVNGEPIQKALLAPGSVILLGETTLKLDLPATSNAAPAPAPVPAAPAPAALPVRPAATPVAAPKPALPLPPKPAAETALPKPAMPLPRAPELPKPLARLGAAPAAPAPVAPGPAVPPPPAASPVVAPPPAPPVAPPPAPVAVIPEPVPVAEPAAPVPAPAPAVPVSPPPAPAILPPMDAVSAEFRKRLAAFLELPLMFTPEMRQDQVLGAVLQRVVQLMPGGQRGALLLLDPVKDKLQLRATVPSPDVIVSESLARRVMTEGHGFILSRKLQGDVALDTSLVKVETGMYAPLLLRERPIGAIYVENPVTNQAFSEDDMQLLLTAAHYAAIAIFNHQLQEQLHHNSSLLEHIAPKFPPRTQERLLDLMRLDKLRPTSGKNEVTMLYAELRGFATDRTTMDPKDVVSMLNDYYPPIVEGIFRYEGTLDKFSGEKIIAVFGSPEPDTQHPEKAVLAALA
ncbi:MAG: FHA domain-containing protein, partial [Verrucomicrobia bacterium]|nr:FHA domain-containing protein [Verrucomicrobiota bacterium]